MLDRFAAMLSFVMLFNVMPLFSFDQGHGPDFRFSEYRPHRGFVPQGQAARSIESGMRPGLIIMSQPSANILPGLQAIFKGVKIYTFIFQTAPQTFNEDIVHPSAFAVHRYLNPSVFQGKGKIKRGKLRPLIRVEYLRLTMASKSLFQSLQAKAHVHGIGQTPGQHLRLYQSIIATR